MTLDESQFSDKTPLAHPISIYNANGTPMPISHKGTISTPSISLSDTFHIPKLSLNLLSIGKLCELGVDILFTNHDVYVLGTSGKVKCLGQAVRLDICLRLTT